MDKYLVMLTVIGAAAFVMTFMPAITAKTKVSYSLYFLVFGVIIYSLFPQHLPSAHPKAHPDISLHLSEMVVIISLMGTGIKIDRPFNLKNWASPLRLVTIAMLLCMLGVAFLAYYILNFDLASAILLAAVLAPTDPVLASDVQVGPPNEAYKSETKFALTAEAGLNDGLAFPFTWLAITIAFIQIGEKNNLLEWFSLMLVYKILAGIAIGYLAGKATGYLIFNLAKRFDFLKSQDGFLALALTLLVYGITEAFGAYGFIAVFISAFTLRHSEKRDNYHHHLHNFIDQTERILIAIVLLLLGGSLVQGGLKYLNWEIGICVVAFLLVIRPLAAYLSLYALKFHFKEKMAISFLGIRGIGSIFYLSFAIKEVDFKFENQLWSAVFFTILVSIVIHGFSAPRIINYLGQNIKKEKVPE
ncbi:cation:proton antiporter [Pedobacter glucosidilyticus]|uniref:cation:proton antiporter n=1 Tax=Pedobacter glucosidilyticus TaxID=1122941 RepID=UPI0026EBFB9A|nr:cation:proton antiporter [Pedobacter glucosidilyticus]